ncbi:MAG: Ribosomal silencing factor RsfS [Spirochaetes bacterium ADurb.Bin269]|nr:MAG: Ribosomal silencing factor RsfS [Spirochaetes bacterium ADurb.Bin269]
MYDRGYMETNTKMADAAVAIGRLLREGKASDVVVLDITGKNSFADFFVIATAASATQSQGLQKQVLGALKDLGLEVRPARRKLPDGDDWVLIDLGDVIVHLMSETARSFYDLEKLWFGAPNLVV